MPFETIDEGGSLVLFANPYRVAALNDDVARMDAYVAPLRLDFEGSVCFDTTGHVSWYPIRHRKLAMLPRAYVLAMRRDMLIDRHRTFLLVGPAAECRPVANDDAKAVVALSDFELQASSSYSIAFCGPTTDRWQSCFLVGSSVTSKELRDQFGPGIPRAVASCL